MVAQMKVNMKVILGRFYNHIRLWKMFELSVNLGLD